MPRAFGQHYMTESEPERRFRAAWVRVSLLVLTLAGILAASSPAQAQFLKTEGTNVVDANGNPILMKGINLGNWLLWEGYLMMGDFQYRTHTQFLNGLKDAFGGRLDRALEFEHQWRLNYVDEQTIIDLKALGFNSVRVPFHYNMFWDVAAGTPSDQGFQYIDQLVDYCRTHGLWVLLDMHAAPGYQNPGDHSDNLDSNADQPRDTVGFWDGNNVAVAAQVWRHIANYYKDEPVIWGYDLLNEPVPQSGREYELLPSLITMRDAIREVDKNHIIVAEGSWWGSDMQKLDWQAPEVQSQSGVTSRWDANLVYHTHHYSDDPSLLQARKDLTDRLNLPLMLGEYGENSNDIIRQMTDWCLDEKVGYFPWSFKKMYHDRCLWTIQQNAAYQAVRDYIKFGGEPPANAYEQMIDFCRNRIGNGGNAFTFHQDFYEAVKYTVAFEDWIAGFASVPAGEQSRSDDPDKDGMSNAAEMYFASSPAEPSPHAIEYQHSQTEGDAGALHFPRSKTVPAGAGTVEWSADLLSWHASGDSADGTTVSLSKTSVDRSNPDYDQIELTPNLSGESSDALFFRFRIIPQQL